MGLLDNTRFFEPFPFAIVIVIAYLFIYLFVFFLPPIKSMAAGSCLQTRYCSSANSLFPSESADLGCVCVCVCSGIRVFNSPATTTAPFAFGPIPRPGELLSTPCTRDRFVDRTTRKFNRPQGCCVFNVLRRIIMPVLYGTLLRPRTRRANFIYTTLEMCGEKQSRSPATVRPFPHTTKQPRWCFVYVRCYFRHEIGL